MSKKSKLIAGILCICCILTGIACAVGAEGTSGTNAITTMTGSLQTALSDFSASNLSTIIVAALGFTVALALAWFAFRFIKGRVSKAMRKGSL